MIYVRDKGRLCNNILQYGHVYAWGREHGRQTVSMRFAYKYQFFHVCHTRHHHFLNYFLAKTAARWGLLPVATFDTPDEDTSRQEQLMLSHRHIVAEGWYARWYDLFLKYKHEIVDLFAFDQKVKTRPDALMASLPACDIRLGVHVRRGDYKTWQGGRYFYDDGQYIGIIRQFVRLHPQQKVQVFVCGNDPSLDRKAFADQLPQAQLCFPDGTPGEDLYLLSQCDWLIGPPSTFTLVAAMYRDVPLYWVKDPALAFTTADFDRFDNLFRRIV